MKFKYSANTRKIFLFLTKGTEVQVSKGITTIYVLAFKILNINKELSLY